MIRRILLSAILIFSLARGGEFPSGENLKPYEGKIIRNIEILRKNVFENGEENLPFYYRWANSLHIKTRKSVIEGELLFKVGEPLDIEKVIESARNIRLRRIIGEVKIIAAPRGEDGVDITVITYDNWTTKVAIFLESGGGSYHYGASVSEDNLLGYGRIAEISASTSEDNDGYTLFFNDDRMGRTRWSGSFFYSDYTLNSLISLQVYRPQYSLDVPYAVSAEYLRLDGTARLYSGGIEFFRYNRLINSFEFNSKYTLGRVRRLNFYAYYDYEDFDYSEYYPGSALNEILIPDDERISFPSLGIGGEIMKYDFERFLDEPGTPEDLTLGATVRLMSGRSVPEFGADFVGTRTAVSTGFFIRPFSPVFIRGTDRVQWWHRKGRNERIRHRSELMFYYKTTETQVFAARALANFVWREKPGYQQLLGGANGLRGYSSHELEGDKLALGNMEYRFYTPLEIFTVRFGGALFFDVGDVWRKGEKVRFGDMKYDVGVGLRFGLTKSSTSRVLRLDFAKALTENEYYVSFGTGMLFNLGSIFKDE
ncbi:MAG: BamA/TamA family outer membrane protein [Candidatus Zixiibacteriota bacterium]|nr:MAG: BamA/TamA family outer membrane protein [candidate division Zixibacteria bacterium]